MSLLRAIAAPRTEFRDSFYTTPAAWLLNALGGSKTTSGQRVTPTTAEGLPVIHACVSILADTVGQLPLKLYRYTEKGKEPATTHPLYSVLHDLPNPLMTAIEFRQAMMRWLALWGNAYAEIERNPRGDVVGLWPLASDRMVVELGPDGYLHYQYRTSKGAPAEWVWDNENRPPLLHLKINSLDGYVGRSPITLLRESLGITMAADQHAASFYGNSGLPDVVLTRKGQGRLKPEAKQHFIESWKEKFSGSAKAHGIALLDDDFTVTPLTMPMRDAQFLEVREFQIEDGARTYRIPLFMLQHNSKETSWGSGIEQMFLAFLNVTMMPWLVLWEQAIARDLLTRKSFETHFAKFSVQGLLRGDSAARGKFFTDLFGVGALSTNDILGLEEMNGIGPEGDRRFVSTNLQPLNAPIVAPAVTPAPAPDEV